jgi:hypothetical protein
MSDQKLTDLTEVTELDGSELIYVVQAGADRKATLTDISDFLTVTNVEFESVSKNLKSWNFALNYTDGVLTSIVYTSGALSVTKTFNYTDGVLTSIVLSGDTPDGINLTKTLGYTLGTLTSVSYS